jgi:hypothetical protein
MENIITYDIGHEPDKFIESLKINNPSKFILYSLEESLNWELFLEEKLPKFLKFTNNLPYELVVNDTCYLDSFNGKEFIKINAFLLKTVFRINEGQPHNSSWNSDSNKSLILTGKPNKPNRIGFLVECVKEGILKDQVYSFFPPKPKQYIEKTKEIFHSLCDWDYDKFCEEYKNNPDVVSIRNNDEDMHYSGFPYSVELFNQTCISVILETNHMSNGINLPDFSEKTYKTIINKHPFLMANEENSLKLLKQQGFYTFDEYMKNPKYDSIKNPYEKNKELVKNLIYFLNNFRNFKDEINEKVEHNYNLIFKIHDDFKLKNSNIYEGLTNNFFWR